MAESQLVGRELELGELERLLDGCRGGSRGLQIEGAAGAGKTAVWQAGLAAARARSYRVLTARPVEIETKLSFAGLTDLLEPLLDDVLPELPEPQRRALEVALLLAPGRTEPDQRGVAAAFLSALRLAARDRPVLVAIDDLQWLDSPSLQVIAFAARRLGPDHVRLPRHAQNRGRPCAGARARAALPAEQLTRVHLGPLSLVALHHLVEADLGIPLPRPSLRRIHAVSEGNPFFALELARALQRAGLGSRDGRRASGPADAPLARARPARAASPTDEREVLLAVAALAAPDPRAARRRSLGATRQRVAAADQRLRVEDRRGRRRSHPVHAPAARVDPLRRHAASRTAGAAPAAVGSSCPTPRSQRATSRSPSTTPDPEVAARLEAAAACAVARGAPSSAGELLELAIGLTPPDDRPTLRGRSLSCGRPLDRSRRHEARARAPRGCRHGLGAGLRAAETLIRSSAGRVAGSGDGSRRSGAVLAGARRGCDDLDVRVSLEKELVWSTHLLGRRRRGRAARAQRALRSPRSSATIPCSPRRSPTSP